MLKSLFNKVEFCEYCVNIAKFLRTPILKNIANDCLCHMNLTLVYG